MSFKRLKRNSGPALSRAEGFTLLELLVVVAILAIIGGALVASYDGLEAQAAKGTATNSIAAVDNAVRSFVVTEKTLPNNVESLLAGDPTSLAAADVQEDNLGIDLVDVHAAATPAVIVPLSTNLEGKIAATALTANQLTSLNNAGITIARYIHNDGNSTTGGALDIIENGAGTVGATVGDINAIDIPLHMFEAPRSGTQNRGRGYPKLLAAGDQVAIWNAGGGYNNIKVGAQPDDVLIAFGIGGSSTLITGDTSGGGVGNVRLGSAPFYGDVAKNEYAHYIMLVNVGPTTAITPPKAKLQAIVDARGDFLAEEFAEATGQKQ